MSLAAFIADQRTTHQVPHAVACRALTVSESWFYKAVGGEPGGFVLDEEAVVVGEDVEFGVGDPGAVVGVSAGGWLLGHVVDLGFVG
ncbi:hypothetical protein ACQPXB_21395 [Amycolatopsis sp. CA-161197]|uniref:hypothetical protein n=1 Tax=Amycolatopsis sp. CA-161197 TaxID=3239922 RepID=UPI003D8CDBA2